LNIHASTIEGVFFVEPIFLEDERGFFSRSFCRDEFEEMGLSPDIKQSNVSYNRYRGTLRGMHFQNNPYQEAKLVRCTRGAIFDVAVDLRVESATYKSWISVELSEKNRKSVYIPPGFAHGFQTLEDGSEVLYDMFESYHAECSAGVRWNDEAFSIKWPLAISNISERDAGFADYS
jgi:dTDP-4-dehydrorhamnose 3,5-epimerase